MRLGSLRCDLLATDEAPAAERDFEAEVEVLGHRLEAAIRWLVAAARIRSGIAAVVSFDGRPDLAGAALDRVSAPTLLLVGDRAPDRVASNRRAEERLGADSRLELVPGADDLLEEAGARRHAWRSATEWLELDLADAAGARSARSPASCAEGRGNPPRARTSASVLGRRRPALRPGSQPSPSTIARASSTCFAMLAITSSVKACTS